MMPSNDNANNTAKQTKSKDPQLYSGKWTPEEEAYANFLIEEFKLGNLSIPSGTTLRGYLARKLDCLPKRVSKKFENTGYNGKQHYSGKTLHFNSAESELRKLKLEHLRRVFLESRHRPAQKGKNKKNFRLGSMAQPYLCISSRMDNPALEAMVRQRTLEDATRLAGVGSQLRRDLVASSALAAGLVSDDARRGGLLGGSAFGPSSFGQASGLGLGASSLMEEELRSALQGSAGLSSRLSGSSLLVPSSSMLGATSSMAASAEVQRRAALLELTRSSSAGLGQTGSSSSSSMDDQLALLRSSGQASLLARMQLQQAQRVAGLPTTSAMHALVHSGRASPIEAGKRRTSGSNTNELGLPDAKRARLNGLGSYEDNLFTRFHC